MVVRAFGEYADAVFNVARLYFNRNISRVDVVFDRLHWRGLHQG